MDVLPLAARVGDAEALALAVAVLESLALAVAESLALAVAESLTMTDTESLALAVAEPLAPEKAESLALAEALEVAMSLPAGSGDAEAVSDAATDPDAARLGAPLGEAPAEAGARRVGLGVFERVCEGGCCACDGMAVVPPAATVATIEGSGVLAASEPLGLGGCGIPPLAVCVADGERTPTAVGVGAGSAEPPERLTDGLGAALGDARRLETELTDGLGRALGEATRAVTERLTDGLRPAAPALALRLALAAHEALRDGVTAEAGTGVPVGEQSISSSATPTESRNVRPAALPEPPKESPRVRPVASSAATNALARVRLVASAGSAMGLGGEDRGKQVHPLKAGCPWPHTSLLVHSHDPVDSAAESDSTSGSKAGWQG
jgi:hypothetical protein